MLSGHEVRALGLLSCIGLVAALSAPAAAQGGVQIEPRIGYKDAPVLENDLRQLGFPDARVVRLGQSAEVRVRVNGEDVRIEMDRRFGGIRILQASTPARSILEKRIPAYRFRPILPTLDPPRPSKSGAVRVPADTSAPPNG